MPTLTKEQKTRQKQTIDQVDDEMREKGYRKMWTHEIGEKFCHMTCWAKDGDIVMVQEWNYSGGGVNFYRHTQEFY